MQRAKDCEAEQDMTDQEFMALHETVETFEQFYGTNDNLSNAYGKCVSAKAKVNKEEMDEEDHEHAEPIKQAARTCMAPRRANLTLFRNTYGTNWNTRKAFGKCLAEGPRGAAAEGLAAAVPAIAPDRPDG